MTTLERFIQLGEIEISRHPKNQMRRLLVLEEGLRWYPTQKAIALNFWVYYLNEDGSRATDKSLQPYLRDISADAHHRIDPQTMQNVYHPGARPNEIIEIVDEEEVVTNQAELDTYDLAYNKWENSVSEYDHFVGAANQEVNIFNVMLTISLFRDTPQGGQKYNI